MASLNMFRTSLRDDDRATGDFVSEEFDAGRRFDGLDEFGWKSFEDGEGIFGNGPGDFPVAGGGVFADGLFGHSGAGRGWIGARGRVVGGTGADVAEAEAVEGGKFEGGDSVEDVGERVGTFVAVFRSVGGVADADGVQDDEEGFH